MASSKYDFNCGDTAAVTPVTIYVRDISGNIDSSTSNVTVLDTALPNLAAHDTTIYLDASGNYTIDTTYILSYASDNCAIDTMWLSRYTFNCIDTLSSNAVTIYVRDVSGNIDSATANVNVVDSVLPTVTVHDTVLYLDASGQITFDTTVINLATYDNCNIDTMWLSQYQYNCIDTASIKQLWLYARDISGNIDSAVANVTIIDSLVPLVSSHDTTIYVDATGNYTIDTTYILSGASDNCAIDTMWLSQYNFNCGDTAASTPVTIFIRDISGNINSSTSNVTVLDTLAPFVFTHDTTVYLSASGTLIIDTTFINDGSYDNCEIDTMWLSRYNFSCIDTNSNPVILYARDISGNIDSSTANVIVVDSVLPVVLVHDTVLYLDTLGQVTIDTSFLNNGTYDNCAIDTMWLSKYSFNCGDSNANVVTYFARDISGNIQNATAIVTILDTVLPTLNIKATYTRNLNVNGVRTITVANIDLGTYDNCAVDTMWLSQYTFNCGNIGTNNVTFYARDVSGNIDSGICVVTINDNTAPNVITQNINAYLDLSGQVIIDPSMINNGSWDSCGIDSMYLSDTIFYCSDIGANNVTLFARDIVGNIGSNTATVTVIDTIFPTVIVYQSPVVIFLDSLGNVEISPATVDSASYDNCSYTLTIDDSTFDCTNAGAVWPVIFTMTDSSGNVSVDTAYVFVNDTIPPVPTTHDSITVYLDSSGLYTVDATELLISLSDTCAISSIVLDTSTFSCISADTFITVTITVTDTNGNVGTDSTVVTIRDAILPAPIAKNITVYLDSFGQVSIDSNALDSASFDNCGIASITVERDTFTCSDLFTPVPIWMYVRDVNGNLDSIQATVHVVDTIAPVMHLYSSAARYLLSTGIRGIPLTVLDSASFDNCAIQTRVRVPASVNCSNVGDTVYSVVTITDASGNISIDSVPVYTYDTVSPQAFAQNITVYLDSFGDVTFSAYDVDSSSSDACGIDTITIDTSYFNCSSIGTPQPVAITVADVNGNQDIASAFVTVMDTIAPQPVVFDSITVYLDTFGFAIIDTSNVNISSWDACGIDTMYLNDTLLECSDVGAFPGVVLTLVDLYGNVSEDSTVITVLDTIAPEAHAFDTIYAYLDVNGQLLITPNDLDSASYDACGIPTKSIDTASYDCSTVGSPQVVTLTVIDPSGNMDQDSTVVIIIDTVSPVAIVQNLVVALDSFGMASITATQIDNGSYDSCGIVIITIDSSNFSCDNLFGPTPIVFTATDINGNFDTAHAYVTVIDTINPIAISRNITVYLDSSGQFTISADTIDSASADNCLIATKTLTQSTFVCGEANTMVGIVLTVTDSSGNSDTASAMVTVLDTIYPEAIAHNITVHLDSFGFAVFTADSVDSASFDNCSIDSIWISDTIYSCIDTASPKQVTLYVRDASGWIDSAISFVTVIDSQPPALVTNPVTVYLDSNGSLTIAADTLDNGTYDNCDVDTTWLSKYTFTCADTNSNNVVFYAKDMSGNVDSMIVVVTVLDTQPAKIHLFASIVVYLDSTGTAVIQGDTMDSASIDNCQIDTIWLDTNTFYCSDTASPNPVMVYVRDISGNIDSAVSYVIVRDTQPPALVTNPVTVYLDSTGSLTIGPDTIDNGTYDNCSVDTTWLSAYTFTCVDTGDTVIKFYAMDISGNVDSTYVIVSIVDSQPPALVTNPVTVYLDSNGSLTIAADTLDNGTYDNCDVDTIWLDKYTFTCSDSNANNVMFYARDISGNVDSMIVVVTVLDTQPVKIYPYSSIEIYLDSTGSATIAPDTLDSASVDNCSIALKWLDINTFDCNDTVAPNQVTLYMRDESGNVDSALSFVIVRDTQPPALVTNPVTVYLDSNGSLTIAADTLDNGTYDNCTVDTTWLSQYVFTCSDSNTNNVTFYAKDISGNVDSTVVVVTVLDTQPAVVRPFASIEIYLDSNGSAVIAADTMDSASSDNCMIDTIWLDVYSFSCSDTVSANPVTLFVRDVSGNVSSALSQVIVRDTQPPALLTNNITVYLDSFGSLTIGPDTVDSASTDNCSIATTWLSATTFSCVDTGDTVITFYAMDVSGNLDSTLVTVTIVDSQPPALVTNPVTVYLDSNGTLTIGADTLNNGTYDNCDVDTTWLSKYTFTCVDSNINNVTFYAKDISGNVDSTVVVVTVLDTQPAVVLPFASVEIYLDSNGNAVIAADTMDSASFDNCMIDTIWLDVYSFSCNDTAAPNPVTLFVRDVSGNISSVVSQVIVRDTQPPVLVTNSITVYLDSNGSLTIGPDTVDSGTSDNCSLDTTWLSAYTFTCVDTGDTMITFYALDISGNLDSTLVTVTVVDSQPPVVNQFASIEIYLDSNGVAGIAADTLDSGSFDNCAIDTMWLSTDTFYCFDTNGFNLVTLYIKDVSGNVDSAVSQVIVKDTQSAVVLTMNDTVYRIQLELRPSR
ncbi:MAG: hypothetical protein R2813_10410 [Flavobacteriales bacterium]